ncbi:MAG: aromatic ring-hydroxylating dioxygenase subunit alpha [Alphaproteobacteria bacterium]|nr:aromatic ring-hydroxylating dioxygenase subunit alpha [Alphaproteobacteria bacterium]
MELVANRWYPVLASAELRPGASLGARRLGHDLVFWRGDDGAIGAAADQCPHRRAKLSGGRVLDGCIECPFHGFRYDRAGACVAIPAHPDRPIPGSMALRALPCREEHDLVWLWTGPDPAPDDPVPFFDFTGWHWAGTDFHEDVATHYTRAVENQLDYAHLPFVHRNTIGRFATVDAEVHTEVDGDRIAFWAGDPDARIELVGPAIWRNRTGSMYQFLAFVPIDDTHMRYYVRTYQRAVRIPGLDRVFGRMLAFANRIVLGQDTPVVETQPAEETRLRMGEVLVPSDAPIIAYRRWREAHRAPFALPEPPDPHAMSGA